MGRLAKVIECPAGDVEVELVFAIGPEGRAGVRGTVATRIRQVCQRCLEPVELLLEKSLNLAVVHSDAEADELPNDLDPLLCGDDPLAVIDLVEDELLLTLPQEPKHTSGPCSSRHVWHSGEPAPETGAGKEAGPFAVLEQLKRRN